MKRTDFEAGTPRARAGAHRSAPRPRVPGELRPFSANATTPITYRASAGPAYRLRSWSAGDAG